jgi:hypothetical protein
MLDRASVSRVHARLNVGKTTLQIEDLHSSNGVFVNGVRIEGSEILRSGDRLLFGTEEFVILSSDDSSSLDVGVASDELPSGVRSIALEEPGPDEWRRRPLQRQPGLQTTQKADAFQILGRLADRMLVMGRSDAAIKILNGHMQELLAAVRAGDKVAPDVVKGSTTYAMKLASSAAAGEWIDYVLELHFLLRSVLEPEVIGQIDLLVRKGVKVDLELFTRYRDMIRVMHAKADPAACRHILEFELPEK